MISHGEIVLEPEDVCARYTEWRGCCMHTEVFAYQILEDGSYGRVGEQHVVLTPGYKMAFERIQLWWLLGEKTVSQLVNGGSVRG